MTLVIELATSDDEAALLSLLAAQFEEHDIHLSDAALRAAVRGPLEAPGRGTFLLARVEGRATGLAYLAHTWTLEHGGRTAWLEELYVLPRRAPGGSGPRSSARRSRTRGRRAARRSTSR